MPDILKYLELLTPAGFQSLLDTYVLPRVSAFVTAIWYVPNGQDRVEGSTHTIIVRDDETGDDIRVSLALKSPVYVFLFRAIAKVR